MKQFNDRNEAGIILGNEILKTETFKKDEAVVIGLPRGGVPVAAQIAKLLKCLLDILLVRKIGLPFDEEFAIGAIADDGTEFLDQKTIDQFSLSDLEIEEVVQKEKQVILKRKMNYRKYCPKKDVKGKTVILTDDGLATGCTMTAELLSIKKEQPKKIIIAVPVSPKETYSFFKAQVDKIVCPLIPDRFMIVGQWYVSFPQVSEEEVCQLLKMA